MSESAKTILAAPLTNADSINQAITLDYSDWFDLNEDDLRCEAAESGADRELDFDWGNFVEKAYDRYEQLFSADRRIEKKIAIATDFVSRHGNNVVEAWPPHLVFGNKKWLAIFANLQDGIYGDVTSDEETDDDGNIVAAATYYRVEIGRFASASGCSVEFEWDA